MTDYTVTAIIPRIGRPSIMVSKYPGLTVPCKIIQEFKSMTDYTVTQSYPVSVGLVSWLVNTQD